MRVGVELDSELAAGSPGSPLGVGLAELAWLRPAWGQAGTSAWGQAGAPRFVAPVEPAVVQEGRLTPHNAQPITSYLVRGSSTSGEVASMRRARDGSAAFRASPICHATDL